ncbi:MAG: hypothetical protein J6D00_02460 [Christensenellaceae bacterium]|nr:hypothetical protein [Christensenellaceae bacterium]
MRKIVVYCLAIVLIFASSGCIKDNKNEKNAIEFEKIDIMNGNKESAQVTIEKNNEVTVEEDASMQSESPQSSKEPEKENSLLVEAEPSKTKPVESTDTKQDEETENKTEEEPVDTPLPVISQGTNETEPGGGL